MHLATFWLLRIWNCNLQPYSTETTKCDWVLLCELHNAWDQSNISPEFRFTARVEVHLECLRPGAVEDLCDVLIMRVSMGRFNVPLPQGDFLFLGVPLLGIVSRDLSINQKQEFFGGDQWALFSMLNNNKINIPPCKILQGYAVHSAATARNGKPLLL